jgi:hypothetical protein
VLVWVQMSRAGKASLAERQKAIIATAAETAVQVNAGMRINMYQALQDYNDAHPQNPVTQDQFNALTKNLSSPTTFYLAGISNTSLANLARSLGTEIREHDWNRWLGIVDRIDGSYHVALLEAKTPEDLNRIKGEMAAKINAAQIQYDKEQIDMIRDADIVRKAILQRLGSYPPITQLDKDMDEMFTRWLRGDRNKSNSELSGNYVINLADQLSAH